jgi:hypothetical protein
MMQTMESIFMNAKFAIKKIPNNVLPESQPMKLVLRQNKLPLCYMYTLHFFMYLFISKNGMSPIKKYAIYSDDIYIMTFTKQVLKLCHLYGFVNDDDYYLLTNNTYKFKQLTASKGLILNNLLEKVSSKEMLKTVYQSKSICSLNLTKFIEIINEFLISDGDSIIIMNHVLEIICILIDNIGMVTPNDKYELYLISNIFLFYEKELIKVYNEFIREFDYPERITFFPNKIKKFIGDYQLRKDTSTNFNLVNHRNSHRNTPLILICKYNKYPLIEYDIAKFLIAHHAEINWINNDGSTALIIAVANNNYEMVKLLLDNYAHIDLQNNIGLTALMNAGVENNAAIFKLLLDHGANTELKDIDGDTVIEYVYEKQYQKIIDILNNHAAHSNVEKPSKKRKID